MRHVLLVGATDGIGLALARLYLGRMWRTGLIGRDPEKVERVARRLRGEFPAGFLATGACDVTDHAAAEPAFATILRALGQMDLMIYCAGAMIDDEGVSGNFGTAAETFAVNTLGAVHFLGLAADYFQSAGRGHLAAIGSVAGERGRKGNPAYCASKAALHVYLEGLRNRLHPYGVRVSSVKPGFVNTRMLRNRARLPGVIEPDRAARLIARGLDQGRESFFVPGWWALVALALRLCPRVVFKRVGPP